MKSKPIIAILATFSSALIACQQEDILEDIPGVRQENLYTQVSKHDARGYFRDITGFDPALQSQLIEMSFPVTVEGVQTNIDAQFSVMPIHVYEDSGADKSGDYYVIEADFTAHNAPLKDKDLFMKSLEVSVTPTSLNDEILKEGTDVFFYDMPSPKTTIANTTYEDNHSKSLNGRVFIGSLVHFEEREMTIWEDAEVYTVDVGKYTGIWPGRLEKMNVILRDINDNIYIVKPKDLICFGNPSYRDFMLSNETVDIYGNPLPVELLNTAYAWSKKNTPYYSITPLDNIEINLFSKDERGVRSISIDENYRNLRPSTRECQFPLYDCQIENGTQKYKVPVWAHFVSASVAFGYSWGVHKGYYREDLTTRLKTNSHCGVGYKYVVENLDSSKGIPRVAQADLNGHATWVWRMPVNASKFTANQLLSNLFKIKVEVDPVYGKLTKIDKDISCEASKSTIMQTSILSAPYRHKMTNIRFTNHGISPMMNVRLLTVPYLKWEEDGRPESEILQQSEDPLMAGESITMPTVETSCYIACEEINPRSLEVECVRQSALIDIKLDANSPQEIKQSTFDTTPVMVYNK